MGYKPHPLEQQVIVITGASSGIGLATARAAAQKGARVVLAARSEAALDQAAREIVAAGGQASAVPCDVAVREQVDGVARAAVERFGRIDTWVNNAAVSIYGRLDVIGEADARRLFDTNFWGVVNGCMAALPHLRANPNGGGIINVGSEVSEAVIPMQAMYSASKHAVKGYNDGLRVELEQLDDAKVAVTLIQPTAVDTPFPEHAKNYMDRDPKVPTPMIDPAQVAEAVLAAAVKPKRSKKVGVVAKVNTAIAKLVPSLGDRIAAQQADRQQHDRPPRNPDGALHRPSETTTSVGETHGDHAK
jgi:short-subunit dehydrogenase